MINNFLACTEIVRLSLILYMLLFLDSWNSSSKNVKHPKIQSDSEPSASTDSDSSIDLDFGPPTPKIQIISPDTVDDDNLINDDSIESDNSSDDELGISVSSPIVLKNNNSAHQCHHPLS